MQLSPEQTARFYRIWLALLRFVNDEQHLVPAFSPAEEAASLPLSDEMQLRVQPLSVGDNSDISPSRLTFPLEAPYASF